MEAYESADKEKIETARKRLISILSSEAKDINEKYIDPPNTTDFAIMFLPFEGLYAEAINSGAVETLQRKYKVNIAGPSTMAALLNSLQMGFKTLAVQKQSAQVWKILGSVKPNLTNLMIYSFSLSREWSRQTPSLISLLECAPDKYREVWRSFQILTR